MHCALLLFTIAQTIAVCFTPAGSAFFFFQVTISYSAGLAHGDQRRNDLRETYFFECDCTKCTAVGGGSGASRGDDSDDGGGNDDVTAAVVAQGEAELGAFLCRCGGAIVFSAPPPPPPVTASVQATNGYGGTGDFCGGGGGGLSEVRGKKAKKKAMAKLTHAQRRIMEREKAQASGGGSASKAAMAAVQPAQPQWRCVACGKAEKKARIAECEEAAAKLGVALAAAAAFVTTGEGALGGGVPGGEDDESKGLGDIHEDAKDEDDAEEEEEEEDKDDVDHSDDEDGDDDSDGDDGDDDDCGSGSGGDPGVAYNALRSALEAAAPSLHPHHALRFASHVSLLGLAVLIAGNLADDGGGVEDGEEEEEDTKKKKKKEEEEEEEEEEEVLPCHSLCIRLSLTMYLPVTH